MTLEQRLTEDMKDAMRAKDELKLSVIRMVRSQILLEKKKGTGVADVPDETVIGLVRGHVKKLKEALEHAEKVGRTDLADQAKAELVIAQAYLPAEIDDAALEAIVAEAVAAAREADPAGATPGPKAMGGIMKAVMEKAKGQADGRRVQEFVKRALGI
jgi:uncharacterized protein YqeY